MTFQLPQNTVFYNLEKALKRYRKLAQDHINLSGHDITIDQLILLVNLAEHPDATQVNLSAYVFKDFASVARMVDILVKKGYLKRSENQADRRKKDLVPTASCKKMIDELIPVVKNYRRMALTEFTEEEISLLSSFLQRLATNCETHLPTAKHNQTI
ncbi:MAG: MarR family transcriptional regulator [Bacteroidota bacterium]